MAPASPASRPIAFRPAASPSARRLAGSVWQLTPGSGRAPRPVLPLIVIEAMKMEIAVQAEQSGTVVELRCQRGQPVAAGETLLVIRT